MALRSSVLTLSATPQKCGSSTSRRTYLEIQVPSGSTAYIGDRSVTTSTGIAWTSTDGSFIVAQSFLEDSSPGEEHWVVGSGTVRVLENGA